MRKDCLAKHSGFIPSLFLRHGTILMVLVEWFVKKGIGVSEGVRVEQTDGI